MTETTADAGHGGHGHDHEDAIHAANPHLQHHYDTPQQQFDAGKLGIWLFLVTEILFFSGLFCAYTIYRAEHPEVFIFAHYYLSSTLGGVNTAVLILSSLTAAWAVRNAQLEQHKMLVVNILITIACAVTFIVIHVNEYWEHYETGLMWTDCENTGGKAPARLKFGVCFKPHEHVWELASFKEKHPEAAELAEKLYKEEEAKKATAARAPAKAAPTGAAPLPAEALPETIPASYKVELPAAHRRAGQTIPAASGVPAAPPAPAAVPPEGAGEPQPAPAAAAPVKGKAKGKKEAAEKEKAATADDAKPAEPAASASAAAPAPSAAAEQPAPAPAAADNGKAEIADAVALANEEARSGKVDNKLGEKLEPLVEAGVIGPESAGGVSYPKNGHVYFALYFFMTGLHSFHVFAGIIVWLWLLIRAFKKQFGPKYFGPIDYAALYWHLVDMIWIYLFPLLYLIH